MGEGGGREGDQGEEIHRLAWKQTEENGGRER